MRVFASTRENGLLRLDERNGVWATATVVEGVGVHAVVAEGERCCSAPEETAPT